MVWTPVQGLAAVKRQTGLERMYPPAQAPASRGLNWLRPLKMMVLGDIRGATEKAQKSNGFVYLPASSDYTTM